jgi:glycerol dehydrogenase-like iron-containing ADH family enzyme
MKHSLSLISKSKIHKVIKEKSIVIYSRSAIKIIMDISFQNAELLMENQVADFQLAEEHNKVEVVYGIGGGSVIDFAKLVSFKLGCKCIVVPTILSNDATFTNVAAIRKGVGVDYVETGFVDEIIIDIEILTQTSYDYHLACVGDILAIQSAMKDWSSLSQQKKYIFPVANGILNSLYQNTHLLRNQSIETLDFLIDLLKIKVHLGLTLGSPYLEEGTEHYFVYYIEKYLKKRYLHGHLVILGVVISSIIQQWNYLEIQKMLGLIKIIPFNIPIFNINEMTKLIENFFVFCSQMQYKNTVLLEKGIKDIDVNRIIEMWCELGEINEIAFP